jgi:hypothetical protein
LPVSLTILLKHAERFKFVLSNFEAFNQSLISLINTKPSNFSANLQQQHLEFVQSIMQHKVWLDAILAQTDNVVKEDDRFIALNRQINELGSQNAKLCGFLTDILGQRKAELKYLISSHKKGNIVAPLSHFDEQKPLFIDIKQ